ncbi:MAG: hypothetical protein D8B42_00970 [Kingella sp. (in: b-proteobacteria)]|nr:MAG: hypothetical protein D8B42_00970 [Kingella sp. (in: b-proteobacteria)]
MSAEELETELRYARSAIWTVAQMGGESAKLLMQYIGWFAPPNGKLSFEQIAAHLAAVQAMFNDSTAAEWKAALRQMLADKVSGSLKMPLTNHLPLEDYLTAARAQQAHRQPENAFEADAPSPSPAPHAVNSSYPDGTQLVPKPTPPPAAAPPSAAQKAKAHELCLAMKQACRARGAA